MANLRLIKREACLNIQRLSKRAFFGQLAQDVGPFDLEKAISQPPTPNNSTLEYFLNLERRGIQWRIVSFDPNEREVCVDVFWNTNEIHKLDVILPEHFKPDFF